MVLEFDGRSDALMHPFDQSGRRHMEYVRERCSFDDLLLEQIFATFDEFYPASVGGDGRDVHDPAFAAPEAVDG